MTKFNFELFTPDFLHGKLSKEELNNQGYYSVIMLNIAEVINKCTQSNILDYQDLLNPNFYDKNIRDEYTVEWERLSNNKDTMIKQEDYGRYNDFMKSLEERKSKELIEFDTKILKKWIDKYFSSKEKEKDICNISKISIEKAIANGPTFEGTLPLCYNNWYKSEKHHRQALINGANPYEVPSMIITLTFGGICSGIQFLGQKYTDKNEILKNIDPEYLPLEEDIELIYSSSMFYIRIGSLAMASTIINIYYYILQSMMKIIDSCPPSERVVDLVTHNQNYIDNMMNNRMDINAAPIYYQLQAPVQPQFTPQPMMPPIQPQDPIINVPVTPSQTVHVEPTSNSKIRKCFLTGVESTANRDLFGMGLTSEQQDKVQKVMAKYNLDNSNQAVVRCFVHSMLN
jgi:hypothetical protein